MQPTGLLERPLPLLFLLSTFTNSDSVAFTFVASVTTTTMTMTTTTTTTTMPTMPTTPTSPHSSMAAMEATSPIPPQPEIHYYGLALVFLAPALGGFLYGFDVGATSFVLAMLRDTRDHDVWWYGFSKWQQGLLVSTLALGALIGSHIVLVFLAQNIGRRKEIRIAATLYILGAMCNVMSGTILATSEGNAGIACLLFGRLLYGAGVGFIMHGAPTYMAEMSPSSVRGAVVSGKETVIVFGIVVGMLMGDLLSDYPDNWTDLYAFSILGAVPMLLLTFKIPRSKRWLLMKGYHMEAKESMQFVYKGNIEDEFDKMALHMDSICCRDNSREQTQHHNDNDDESDVYYQEDDHNSVYSDNGSPTKTPTDRNQQNNSNNNNNNNNLPLEQPPSTSMFAKEYRPIIMIGVGLLVSQQFSGQPSVLAYSRVLFEAAGWQGHTNVITVIIMALTSTVTVSLVDRLGRKVLLGLGCLIMTGALIALSYGFWGWDDDDYSDYVLSESKKQIILWGMFVYIAGYQVGFGPITWCVLSEIYPSQIRGQAMAFSVEVNFFCKFLCQLCFPIIQDFLGWGTTFALFACIVVCSLFFIGTMVPETKGMSLEEIQVQMKLLYGSNKQPSIVQPLNDDSKNNPLLASPPARGLTPIV